MMSAMRPARTPGRRAVALAHAWLAALLLFMALPCHSLRPGVALAQYRHAIWTVNDGLPGAVRSISQSADGYLWIGTSGGLVKFDGVTFKPVDSVGTQSIKSVMVTDILFSAGGRLDLGTEGFGEVSLADG